MCVDQADTSGPLTGQGPSTVLPLGLVLAAEQLETAPPHCEGPERDTLRRVSRSPLKKEGEEKKPPSLIGLDEFHRSSWLVSFWLPLLCLCEMRGASSEGHFLLIAPATWLAVRWEDREGPMGVCGVQLHVQATQSPQCLPRPAPKLPILGSAGAAQGPFGF